MRSFFVCVVLLFATSISLAQNAIDAQDWSLPLFLWQTTQDSTTYHTALLPKAPSAYLSSTGANYTLVFEEPVAFAFELDDNASEILSYPLVTLKLYYSASRADFQTTTRSLSELNTHGGTYEYITTIGAAASTPGQGFAAASFVPLSVSYDDDAADSATAPLSFQDLNLLLSSSDLERKYRQGSLVGHVARAPARSCATCEVGYSEAYPSAGGADCAYPCNEHGQEHSSCFDSTFEVGDISSPEADAFKLNMEAADRAIQAFGDATVTPLSSNTHIHLSFNYFCCYSKTDTATIKRILHSFEWPAVEISYDRPVWRIDSDAADVDHYSAIVLLDEASQQRMQDVMLAVEAAIRSAGVDVHVPRSQQEPFHSTLAVVSGKSFPAIAALQAINEAVPPGTWNSAGPITLSKPSF